MEILVWIRDKASSADRNVDRMLYKAGDVICFKPDGSDWGIAEISHPDWRIVRVPGMTIDEAESLVAPELPERIEDADKMRRRGLRLDLAALDAKSGGALLAKRSERSDPKKQALIDLTAGAKDVRDAIVLKPRSR